MKTKKRATKPEFKLQTLAGTYYPKPKIKKSTTRPVVEIPTTDLDTVTLLASGYDWTCLNCEYTNHTVEVKEIVQCLSCDKEFNVVVEHATEKG